MVTVGLPLPHSHHSIEPATKRTDVTQNKESRLW